MLDRQGNLLEDVVLGEGDMYHPGGLDVDRDGTIWLPVAEYRPDSQAIVYKVDPRTFEATKMFTVDDHVGGVVRDQVTGRIVGQSWGSRRFYEWTTDGRQKARWLNDSHFVDYQDCEYVASRKALCSGIAGLPAQPGAGTPYELGGFALLDLKSRSILHEVPTQLWSTAGHVVTRNPTDIDAVGRPPHDVRRARRLRRGQRHRAAHLRGDGDPAALTEPGQRRSRASGGAGGGASSSSR